MTAVALRAPNVPRSPLEQLRRAAAKDRCMDAIGLLMANARSHGDRVDMGKRIIRYGAMALCHFLGLRLTAAYLQSLAGQILAEADRFGG